MVARDLGVAPDQWRANLADPAARPVPRLARNPTNEPIKAMLLRPVWPSTRAMIILAAWQGMRVHEIAHHRGEYIDLHTSTLRIRGKGGSDKAIPLSPVAQALVPQTPIAIISQCPEASAWRRGGLGGATCHPAGRARP